MYSSRPALPVARALRPSRPSIAGLDEHIVVRQLPLDDGKTLDDALAQIRVAVLLKELHVPLFLKRTVDRSTK